MGVQVVYLWGCEVFKIWQVTLVGKVTLEEGKPVGPMFSWKATVEVIRERVDADLKWGCGRDSRI